MNAGIQNLLLTFVAGGFGIVYAFGALVVVLAYRRSAVRR